MQDDPSGGPPSLEDLAKEYVDLWRDQLQGMAQDPNVNAALAQTMQMMKAGLASFAAAAESDMRNGGERSAEVGSGPRHDGEPPRAPNAGHAVREHRETETASPASGPTDGLVSDLQKRLAELESRIAALEAGVASSGVRAREKT